MDWTDILRLAAILGLAYGAWELWRRKTKPGGRQAVWPRTAVAA